MANENIVYEYEGFKIEDLKQVFPAYLKLSFEDRPFSHYSLLDYDQVKELWLSLEPWLQQQEERFKKWHDKTGGVILSKAVVEDIKLGEEKNG